MFGMSKQAWIILGALVAVVLIFSVRDNGQGAGASSPRTCRFTVHADILNVRQGPTTKAQVVGTFERGAETGAEKTVHNGFRKIGNDRWAATEFLRPVDGSTC